MIFPANHLTDANKPTATQKPPTDGQTEPDETQSLV